MIPPAFFLIITVSYLLTTGSEPGAVYISAFTFNLPSGSPLVFSVADIFTAFALAVLFASIFGQPSRLSVLIYIIAGVSNALALAVLQGASTAAFAIIMIMSFFGLFIQLVKMERRWTT